jgi:hypothetical protein
MLKMLKKLGLPLMIIGSLTAAVFSQTVASSANTSAADAVRSSPAFAEVLLKRTELESELESLLIDYTDEYPRVKEIRYSLTVLKRDMDKIAATKPADTGKLTLALGKLMIKRMELETDLWELLQTYKDEHPDVKRAKRRVEIYERAINEITG